MANLTVLLGQLQAERKRIRHELKRLESAIGALKDVGSNTLGAAFLGRRPRRRLSVAARRRIAAAQRARWAKVKALKKAA